MAIEIESEIRQKKRQLKNLVAKSINELEVEEKLKAEYEGRAPKPRSQLEREENDNVETARKMVRSEIQSAEANLDLIYPITLRAAVEERERQQANDAMKRISEMGNRLSKTELKALTRAIKRVQDDDEEDDDKEA